MAVSRYKAGLFKPASKCSKVSGFNALPYSGRILIERSMPNQHLQLFDSDMLMILGDQVFDYEYFFMVSELPSHQFLCQKKDEPSKFFVTKLFDTQDKVEDFKLVIEVPSSEILIYLSNWCEGELLFLRIKKNDNAIGCLELYDAQNFQRTVSLSNVENGFYSVTTFKKYAAVGYGQGKVKIYNDNLLVDELDFFSKFNPGSFDIVEMKLFFLSADKLIIYAKKSETIKGVFIICDLKKRFKRYSINQQTKLKQDEILYELPMPQDVSDIYLLPDRKAVVFHDIPRDCLGSVLYIFDCETLALIPKLLEHRFNMLTVNREGDICARSENNTIFVTSMFNPRPPQVVSDVLTECLVPSDVAKIVLDYSFFSSAPEQKLSDRIEKGLSFSPSH